MGELSGYHQPTHPIGPLTGPEPATAAPDLRAAWHQALAASARPADRTSAACPTAGCCTCAKPTPLLRITWVHDNLAHVLDHSHTDETPGTWTGVACSAHGLALGADVDIATLGHLAAASEIAGQLGENLRAIWSQGWSANYAALEFMQGTGLTRFAPVKPQQWVVASFEHQTSPHGLPRPHMHNVILTSLTTGA
jgi:hypothetical protein